MRRPMIYVASSWKNSELLTKVHGALDDAGLDSWDFRKNGFWWEDVDSAFLASPQAFLRAPESLAAFEFDKRGLDSCDGVIAVLPAGISTALEVGYAAGLGKPVIVWGNPREERLDIMWRFARSCLAPEVDVRDVVQAISLEVRT